MNEDIKKKWLEALRSGKYQQGTGFLQKEGRYCCLGVLCDLFAEDDDCDGEWVQAATGAMKFKPSGDPGRHDFLPVPVSEWADLEHGPYDPIIGEGDDTLSQLNDHGKTFKEIADVIEEHL